MWPGVSKSGSPISRCTTERPVASSARALTSTSNAVSWPMCCIRSAGCIPIARSSLCGGVFISSRKLRLCSLAQLTSFFCSRKLRLAPQDYSPWTPPSDRFLVRSYPPASRHPPVLDLVAPLTECSVILSEASLRAKSKDPHLVASSGRVADPSQAQDDS